MTVSPPLSGIDIGIAANATRVLLDRLLVEESLTFDEWVAGFTLLQIGPSVRREELVQDLAGKLSRQQSAIDDLLATTVAKGLIQKSSPDGASTVFDLTADGFARIQRVRAGTVRITEELYGPMDQSDLRTAGRVLREVTARARELAARS